MLGGDVPERPPPSTPTSSSTSTDQNKETRKLQKNSFPPESWTIDPPIEPVYVPKAGQHEQFPPFSPSENAGFAASDQEQKFHKTIAFHFFPKIFIVKVRFQLGSASSSDQARSGGRDQRETNPHLSPA
eukprot:EG_transcript_46529